MRKNGWLPALQGLSYLSQVGLSVAAPIVLMLLLASWLQRRVGLGAWVFVPALVLGLGAAACSFAGFAKYMARKTRRSTQQRAQNGEAPVYVPRIPRD